MDTGMKKEVNMNTSVNPVKTTIIFGAGCSFFYLAFYFAQPFIYHPALFFPLFVWGCVAGYSLLLARWTKTGLVKLILPLALLMGMVFVISSKIIFICLSAATLGWIRSRICFEKKTGFMLLIECLTCGVGILVVFAFFPANSVAVAMGILLFFLIQSLYFLVTPTHSKMHEESKNTDPFESAFQSAKQILASDEPI